MARAKRASDETYNARRRAKRALARLDRDIKEGKVKRSRQITAYQKELRTQISESYIGRNATPSKLSSAQQAARTLDKYRIGAKAEATERRNVVFRANIKASSAGSGTIPKANVQLFWNATKHAWAGRGRDRYAAIQRYYGTDDLQAIFNKVMEANKGALTRIKGLSGSGFMNDTLDPASALQQALGEGVEPEDITSPLILAYTVPVYNV